MMGLSNLQRLDVKDYEGYARIRKGEQVEVAQCPEKIRKGEEVHEPGDVQPAAERLQPVPATAHTWVSDGFGMFWAVQKMQGKFLKI